MEKIPNNYESKSSPKIEIANGYVDFVPAEFFDDPIKYFEEQGKNIKSGEIKYDENGRIKEDPTAVKDLPSWKNGQGEVIEVVGKKINIEKSQVASTQNPFHEYEIMDIAQEFGLPAPKPLAKVAADNSFLIVMEKINGFRWVDTDVKAIEKFNLTENDKDNLLSQAQKIMDTLRDRYEEVGLTRTWKLKDMIFDVDFKLKKVMSIVPTDWERTRINREKLAAARDSNSRL